MGLVEMVMPKMGESIMEGTILSWLKEIGDTIEQDEPVLEVATDKVDTEVPALEDGVLKEILVKEGDVVAVGSPIAIIEVEGAGETAAPTTTTSEAPKEEKVVAEATPVSPEATNTTPLAEGQNNGFYSPLVKNIAKTENIAVDELSRIPGTGKEGRLTKDDILAYLENRSAAPAAVSTPVAEAPKAAPAQAPKPSAPVTPVSSVSGEHEIIQMDRMRKMIAERMVESKHTSPHVTSFVEADMTNLVNWRNQWKNVFKQREGSNLTFTPLLIHAIAKALKDFPMMNVSVEGDKIIKKKDVNIGMAVALPSGNLIVPVIHNADHYSLSGLTLKVNDLVKRARENKLTADDLQGGTYTMSNIGSFGNIAGTPIIMQPQVGIMAFGSIDKKPAVVETPQGDFIGIRHMCILSHSYDHRVVDGALGGMFVRKVGDYLEQWSMDTTV
ncbi:dihydrolipoamide acetyltransferase family protein [Sediminitomix flava]|uniref:Dihydrolipoamide acetyltransferase component of pyruvate dehydrogenase complex n=1 Tax=Sediminitomix flava TaxID=379075 RepID=A0A315ZGP5_SEDFL|nr:dihydrolipoamide acetyltransferase family protein [Sediminitomix flava]PWJ44775.1 2-oxoglutarate dehydrogenase E2 component (dihydrolipoamide succinyltransferase) [Sediminitomix flava]